MRRRRYWGIFEFGFSIAMHKHLRLWQRDASRTAAQTCCAIWRRHLAERKRQQCQGVICPNLKSETSILKPDVWHCGDIHFG